jgi:hypothetical protein
VFNSNGFYSSFSYKGRPNELTIFVSVSSLSFIGPFLLRSNFADDYVPKDLFNAEGTPFDLSTSTRFPKGFDLYKEPYEGYTHAPRYSMFFFKIRDLSKVRYKFFGKIMLHYKSTYLTLQ